MMAVTCDIGMSMNLKENMHSPEKEGAIKSSENVMAPF